MLLLQQFKFEKRSYKLYEHPFHANKLPLLYAVIRFLINC